MLYIADHYKLDQKEMYKLYYSVEADYDFDWENPINMAQIIGTVINFIIVVAKMMHTFIIILKHVGKTTIPLIKTSFFVLKKN